MERVVGQVDLNASSIEELKRIPGISASLARAIVARRTEVGRFEHIDDLLAVRGMRPAVLRRLESHVTVGGLPATPAGPAAVEVVPWEPEADALPGTRTPVLGTEDRFDERPTWDTAVPPAEAAPELQAPPPAETPADETPGDSLLEEHWPEPNDAAHDELEGAPAERMEQVESQASEDGCSEISPGEAEVSAMQEAPEGGWMVERDEIYETAEGPGEGGPGDEPPAPGGPEPTPPAFERQPRPELTPEERANRAVPERMEQVEGWASVDGCPEVAASEVETPAMVEELSMKEPEAVADAMSDSAYAELAPAALDLGPHAPIEPPQGAADAFTSDVPLPTSVRAGMADDTPMAAAERMASERDAARTMEGAAAMGATAIPRPAVGPLPAVAATEPRAVRAGVSFGQALGLVVLGGLLGAVLALATVFLLNGSLTYGRPIASLQGDLIQLQAARDAMNGRLGTLDTQVQLIPQMRADMDGLTTNLKTLDDSMSGLRTDVGTLDSNLGQLGKDVAGVSTNVDAVRGRVGTMETAVQSAQSSITRIDGQVATIRDQAQRFDTFLAGLDQLLRDTGPSAAGTK